MDQPLTASLAQDEVWKALAAEPLAPEGLAEAFAARLARENGWSAAFTLRVIAEYRRFCLLAVRAGHPVTPSDAVDQAWHLHLLHTRAYWERFCPEVLGRPLHHGPNGGSAAESAHFFEQYVQTLRSYERWFGPPPADIWPPAAQRIWQDGDGLRRSRRGWRRQRLLWLALGIGLGAAIAWTGSLT